MTAAPSLELLTEQFIDRKEQYIRDNQLAMRTWLSAYLSAAGMATLIKGFDYAELFDSIDDRVTLDTFTIGADVFRVWIDQALSINANSTGLTITGRLVLDGAKTSTYAVELTYDSKGFSLGEVLVDTSEDDLSSEG